MSIPMRLVAIVLSFVLPPASVFMIRGLSSGFLISLLGVLAAQGIFWGLAAFYGLALWGLAILHALIIAVFMKSRNAGLQTRHAGE